MVLAAIRKMKYILFLIFFFQLNLSYAQPKATRQDISIKQLGIIGKNSVRIKRDPTNGNLYILQNNGIISRVNFAADSSVTFTTVYKTSDHGLNAPLGITFGKDGTMYLVGNDSTSVMGTATIVRGVPVTPGSETRTWNVIATTVAYPYGNVYNHRMSGVVVNLTGDSIYVNSGANTDHGELEAGYREVGLTDIILKLPVNGKNIILQNDRSWLRTNGYLFAEGIRNTFDLAYNANNDLIGVENSDDRDDPDEMNWLQEGHHYGFPWRIGGDNTPQQYVPYNPMQDPLLSKNAWGGGNLYTTYSNDPTYPQRPDSITFTEPIKNYGPDADKFRDTVTGAVQDASNLGIAAATFTAHRSPDGIVFDNDSALAGNLKGGAFITSLANGSLVTALGDTSEDLMLASLTKQGDSTYTAHVTRLVSGFNSPLGVELVGNKLFVVETGLFVSNNSPKLWQITLPENKVTAVIQNKIQPRKFELYQNYPNPFNPSTTIKYELSKQSKVVLKVYDILGNEAATLVNEDEQAGVHEVQFNTSGKQLASGIYFYRLQAIDMSGPASNLSDVKKFILLK